MAKNLQTMALDVGEARVGVALSDRLAISSNPYATYPLDKNIFSKLAALVAEREIAEIIVGLPIQLDGTVGPRATKTMEFIDQLRKFLNSNALSGVEIKTWDERFTTAQAERVIAGAGLKNRKRREALDRISASIILQSYLTSQNHF